MKLMKTATIAAMLIAIPAQAQQDDDAQYRPLAVTNSAGIMVSAEVSGPREARRFREVMVLRKRSDTGADAFVVDFVADCVAGTIQLEAASTYQENVKLRDLSASGSRAEKPQPDSISADMLNYACTGQVRETDQTIVTGLPDAFAHGRKLME